MATGHPKGPWRNREWRGRWWYIQRASFVWHHHATAWSGGRNAEGGRTSQILSECAIWPSGDLGSTCLPSYYWSWNWWDHLPFPGPGSKQRLNQLHLLHGSILLLTFFPCFSSCISKTAMQTGVRQDREPTASFGMSWCPTLGLSSICGFPLGEDQGSITTLPPARH